MAATLTAPDPGIFSAEVLAFAAERGVTEHLTPLYELARQCFPQADVAVRLELDGEIAGLGWIVYAVVPADRDEAEIWTASDRWRKALVASLAPEARQPFGLDVR